LGWPWGRAIDVEFDASRRGRGSGHAAQGFALLDFIRAQTGHVSRTIQWQRGARPALAEGSVVRSDLIECVHPGVPLQPSSGPARQVIELLSLNQSMAG
jgi:hypothetical protein